MVIPFKGYHGFFCIARAKRCICFFAPYFVLIVTCDELHVTLEECCKYLGFCLDHLKSQFFIFHMLPHWGKAEELCLVLCIEFCSFLSHISRLKSRT
jgi:hypothetical protein